MTSCGQVTTQPAHPVHNPVVMTSAYSSFHCAVQRSALGAGAVAGGSLVIVMATSVGAEGTATGSQGLSVVRGR